MLVAFQSLMASFVQPVESLSQVGAALQQLRGDVERLDDVLEHERDETGRRAAARTERRSPAPHAASSSCSEVTFGYLPFSPPLIEELDLHIAPGAARRARGRHRQRQVHGGEAGVRPLPPLEGEILFDGAPRESLPRSALIVSVAMVDQDITLFEGTVRENLTLWDDTIPEVDVVQAAKDACIHDDIAKLPGGYDARVHRGRRQLQRRAAAAPRDRARARAPAGARRPRRGDERARPRDRAAGRREPAAARLHLPHHRAPPQHHPRLRRDHRARARTRRAARLPRRAARPAGGLYRELITTADDDERFRRETSPG